MWRSPTWGINPFAFTTTVSFTLARYGRKANMTGQIEVPVERFNMSIPDSSQHRGGRPCIPGPGNDNPHSRFGESLRGRGASQNVAAPLGIPIVKTVFGQML